MFGREWAFGKYLLKIVIFICYMISLLFCQFLDKIALPSELLLSEFENDIWANHISFY